MLRGAVKNKSNQDLRPSLISKIVISESTSHELKRPEENAPRLQRDTNAAVNFSGVAVSQKYCNCTVKVESKESQTSRERFRQAAAWDGDTKLRSTSKQIGIF